MTFYDLLRMEIDGKVREVAGKLGVTLVEGLRVSFAESLKVGKQNVGRARVLFISFVPDDAFLSLAKQKNTYVGVFLSDINERNLSTYMEILRLLQRARIRILLATGARKVSQMRSGRDMASLGVLLGLRKENAIAAVSKRWGELLEAP